MQPSKGRSERLEPARKRRRQPLQARQDRNRGVEQRPVPEIAVGMRHDRGPRRLGRGENADQPAALLELPVQPLRHDLGRAIEDDHVIGRVGRIALGGRRRPRP